MPKKPALKLKTKESSVRPTIKTLRQLHPAHELDRDHRKAYLATIVSALYPCLDDQAIREGYRFLADELETSLDSSFWRNREIDRNCRAAREGKLSEDEAAAAHSAQSKFIGEQLGDKKNDVMRLRGISSARWTTYKRDKTFLFLDCARVLHAVGIVDCQSQIDQLAELLKVEATAITTIKEYIPSDNSDSYRTVCQNLDQLVNKPKSSSKKAPTTKSPVKSKKPAKP